MNRLPRRLAALAVAVAALALAQAPAAFADGGNDNGANDNAAVAINTTDNSSVFDLAFSIRDVMNGVVDQTNTAVAYASCNSCRSVAIAIQIVLVMGDVTSDDPDLLLPHPRARERAFVLRPWCDLEPDAALPGQGRVTDLLPAVADQELRRRDDLSLQPPA